MKCQRIASVDVEVRTVTFLSYRSYGYFDISNSFVILLCLFQFIRKIKQDTAMYQNFIILYFLWSSTCFGRHTAHHQEPITTLAASGFSYVKGCLDVYLVDVVRHSVSDSVHQLQLYYDARIHESQILVSVSLFVKELSLKAEIILLTTACIVKLKSSVHTTDVAKYS
jgi:hypothetical protein